MRAQSNFELELKKHKQGTAAIKTGIGTAKERVSEKLARLTETAQGRDSEKRKSGREQDRE